MSELANELDKIIDCYRGGMSLVDILERFINDNYVSKEVVEKDYILRMSAYFIASNYANNIYNKRLLIEKLYGKEHPLVEIIERLEK